MARTLFKIVYSRFKQFGGLRVVRYYARMGALRPLVRGIMRNPFSRRSVLGAYQKAVVIVGEHLKKQYESLMWERKDLYSAQDLVHEKSRIVWFCWLQGMEQAPQIVKVCYASLVKRLPDREVRFVDGNNWKEYVELPDYILKKWEKKQIPPAHFADILRLELLIRYGGTWNDATVLCTGITPENEKDTLSYLDADLFMFQYTEPGSNQWGGISNWFISACSNNEVLMVLRDMVFVYWKDYDCMIDYYIFHLFFSMLRAAYPEPIAAMPYGYSRRSLALGYNWGKRFDKEKWDRLTSKVCFHKLSYNVRDKVKKDKGNYYHFIVGGGGMESLNAE